MCPILRGLGHEGPSLSGFTIPIGRLKEDALQDLPPKIIQDYYCELSLLQVSLLLWPTIKVRHWVDL